MEKLKLADSLERVAFDLMQVIAEAEAPTKVEETINHSRKYYLELFDQCRSVVQGVSPQNVLKQ